MKYSLKSTLILIGMVAVTLALFKLSSNQLCIKNATDHTIYDVRAIVDGKELHFQQLEPGHAKTVQFSIRDDSKIDLHWSEGGKQNHAKGCGYVTFHDYSKTTTIVLENDMDGGATTVVRYGSPREK